MCRVVLTRGSLRCLVRFLDGICVYIIQTNTPPLNRTPLPIPALLLLPPTLRYLLATAVPYHPRYLIHLLNSFDEAYALLFLLIERGFLRNYGGGSFTENFYGLKRERVLRVPTATGTSSSAPVELPRAQIAAPSAIREALKLREIDIWKNLAVLVGVPYLHRKFSEGYDIHIAPERAAIAGFADNPTTTTGDGAGGRPFATHTPTDTSTVKQRIKQFYLWFLRRVYPHLNATCHILTLAFQIAYLFDASRYHSPLLWLARTRIRRMGPADYRHLSEQSSHSPAGKANTARAGTHRARCRV